MSSFGAEQIGESILNALNFIPNMIKKMPEMTSNYLAEQFDIVFYWDDISPETKTMFYALSSIAACLLIVAIIFW